MAKGAAIRFTSYEESVSKLLDVLKLGEELKKYDKIVLKPFLTNPKEESTSTKFVESVLKFCIENKNPVADVFIAEGAEEDDTVELFEALGYNKLAEKYGIGLIDLNDTETDELDHPEFLRFSTIHFPSVLLASFLISIPPLAPSEETLLNGSLSNMQGAFPFPQYSGFFSQGKNKIRKWPIEYSIHDILKCKTPDFAVLDASERGQILAGLPFDMDKQAAGLLGVDWKDVPYLSLIDKAEGIC